MELKIICVDDGSTDGSIDILKLFSDDKRLSVLHQIHGGVSSARNHALDDIEKGGRLISIVYRL